MDTLAAEALCYWFALHVVLEYSTLAGEQVCEYIIICNVTLGLATIVAQEASADIHAKLVVEKVGHALVAGASPF